MSETRTIFPEFRDLTAHQGYAHCWFVGEAPVLLYQRCNNLGNLRARGLFSRVGGGKRAAMGVFVPFMKPLCERRRPNWHLVTLLLLFLDPFPVIHLLDGMAKRSTLRPGTRVPASRRQTSGGGVLCSLHEVSAGFGTPDPKFHDMKLRAVHDVNSRQGLSDSVTGHRRVVNIY